MANNNEDDIFTFDINPFLKGLKKVSEGMSALQKNAADMAKSVSSGMMNAAAKIGLLGVGFSLVKKAINAMPEIGKTFGIAQEIISKNFLYPLRQAIFPLLQKFLNWVRDNRAMFVKWGTAVANIFRMVVSGVKQIIEFGSKMANAFKDFINKTFGLQIKSFEDFINVLTFKIAVLAQFFSEVIGGLFKPNKDSNSLLTVIKGIVTLFSKIINFIKEIGGSFLEGFMPHLKEMATPLQRIVDAVTKIFDKLFGGSKQLEIWKGFFQWLGDWTGGAFMETLNLIAGLLEAIADSIEFIMDIPDKIKEALEKEKHAQAVILEKKNGQYYNANDVWAGTQFGTPINVPNQKVKDAIITKNGQVIQTDPNDNLYAFKGNPAGGKNIKVDINFPGMQLVIQQATQEEANRFSDVIVNTFRSRLTWELERAGVK